MITLKLNRQEFPNVIATYGMQADKIAVQMCLSQNMEITETNCYSVLLNLESDLEMQRATAAGIDDTEEEEED